MSRSGQTQANRIEELEARLTALQSLLEAQQQQPNRSVKTLRHDDIPLFEAKSIEEYRRWKNSAENILKLKGANYPDEESGIRDLSRFLGTKAQRKWETHIASTENAYASITYGDFFELLYSFVEDPATSYFNTQRAYSAAIMKPGQSLDSFATYLAALEAQLGSTLTDEMAAQQYLMKIHTDLRVKILESGDIPATRKAMHDKALRMETALRTARLEKNRQSNAASIDPAGTQQSNNRVGPVRTPGTASMKAGSRRSEPYRRDTSNVTCFSCQGKGHFARDCPTNRNQGPATGSNATVPQAPRWQPATEQQSNSSSRPADNSGKA